MKIVITSQGKDAASTMTPRFGRCEYFYQVDLETGKASAIENTGTDADSGAGVQAAQFMVDRGIDAVITGHVGPKAFAVLEAAGIQMLHADGGTMDEILQAFKSGLLKPVSDEVNAPASQYSAAKQPGDTRRIAVSAMSDQGLDAQVGEHFGRCPFYVFVDVAGKEITQITTKPNPYYPNHEPGQIPGFIHSQGANIMLAGGMGQRAVSFFNGFGIDVATGASGMIRDALNAFFAGTIEPAEPCHHEH